ncbi:Protein kinase domain-containing protein [Trichostrongylus colubriformis]|uniref:Protein kinase domain-containing protein n=1 Tax=Trichostrongylus colubriformis TaxID=6319 RepID=A0AAN8F4G2_TRICO
MSAAVAEKSPKTTEIDKKEVEALTNVLFLRKSTEKESSLQKARKKSTKAQSTTNYCEAHMVGTIEDTSVSAKLEWRIMGMRMNGCPWIEEKEFFACAVTTQKLILRFSLFINTYIWEIFKHEYNMFKMLAKWYPSSIDRIHYPSILGQGALSELRFLNLTDNSARRHDTAEKPSVPRPYFILESFEPSLETLFKSNRNKSLSVNVSVFVTIGCMKALRLLHMKGFAHRNVQPAYFSIRFPCGGLLVRKESELCDLVAITELWCCRKFRANIPRSRASLCYLGNWKYGSVETLNGKEPTAIDDLISCIYIMTEFVLGQIPWHKEQTKQAIINMKHAVEGRARIEDQKGTTLLNHYSKIFEWLRQQPLLQTINYEALYEEILKMPDTGQTNPAEQSLFGFSNPLLDAYDHGFTEKKAKDKKSRVREKDGSPRKRIPAGSTSAHSCPTKNHKKLDEKRSRRKNLDKMQSTSKHTSSQTGTVRSSRRTGTRQRSSRRIGTKHDG